MGGCFDTWPRGNQPFYMSLSLKISGIIKLLSHCVWFKCVCVCAFICVYVNVHVVFLGVCGRGRL